METAQEIHHRMLKNTADSFDKSNGSFIFDAEKAMAIEISNQQSMIAEVLSKQNISNLKGDELALAVYERSGGIRKPAVKSQSYVIISGSQGASVTKGDLVATDTVNFIIQEDKTIDATGSIVVLVECELAGIVGNVPPNSINRFPVTLPGIINVYNPESISNGYEAETDEQLLERHFERLQNPGKSGNPAHYKEWAKEVVGVGDAKIFPRYNGPLTMKVVIIDANKQPASDDLVQKVFDHISKQMPFGVEDLAVKSAIGIPINISVTLSLVDGYTEPIVKQYIAANIIDYLKEIAFKVSYVSYAKTGSEIIDSEGILDYQDLLINGSTANVAIPDEGVPVMGGINE